MAWDGRADRLRVDDPAWTLQKFNITGNVALDFKVRFCVARTMGSPEFAGWSLDRPHRRRAACAP